MSRALGVAALLIHQRKRIHVLEERLRGESRKLEQVLSAKGCPACVYEEDEPERWANRHIACSTFREQLFEAVEEVERLRQEKSPQYADTRLMRALQEVKRLADELDRLREEKRLIEEECSKAVDRCEKTIARLREENERLRELLDAKALEAAGSAGTLSGAEAENARLREYVEYAEVGAEVLSTKIDTLLAALRKAGDRLAQVQPGVTESWAFDIIPLAEQEIATAISEVEGEK